MMTKARTYKTLEAAAKKLGTEYGYKGFPGGHIYRKNKAGTYSGQSVMQGWWNLGRRWQEKGLITGGNGFAIDWVTAAVYFNAGKGW